MEKNSLIMPILKWVGGKRQLLPEINKYKPKSYNVYCEAFLGGGAVFFNLEPKKAIVNDINEELINLYKVIENNVEELIKELESYKNTSEFFYNIRALDRDKAKYNLLTDVEKAARILYLNKTCFNGMFRVNSQGEFNVPYGNYKKPNYINIPVLKALNIYFNENNISFLNEDFEKVFSKLNKNDFVYLDPPYDPVSDTSSFTGYNIGGFDKNEQIRLKKSCDELDKKGIKFLLSNSATPFILDLYKDYEVNIVKAKRSINSVGSKRGKVDEVLIRNYEK